MGGVPVVKSPKWPAVSLGAPSFVVEAAEPLLCTSEPDGWHSSRTTSEGAERLCAGCGYVEACRAYALGDPQLTGVWGGTTAVERRRVRAREAERRRRAAKVAA